MIIRTGKKPHVEHFQVAESARSLAFQTEDTFGNIPLPELSGTEVWVVRFGPREEKQPIQIFWAEPRIEQVGFSEEWPGEVPESYREAALNERLRKFSAPDDASIDLTHTSLFGGVTVRVKFWVVTA